MAVKNSDRVAHTEVAVKSIRYGKTAAKDARPPVFYAFIEGQKADEEINFIAYNTTALSLVEIVRDLAGELQQMTHPGALRDGSYFKADIEGDGISVDFKDCVRKEHKGQVIFNFKGFAPSHAADLDLEAAKKSYVDALKAAFQGAAPTDDIDLDGEEHVAGEEPDQSDTYKLLDAMRSGKLQDEAAKAEVEGEAPKAVDDADAEVPEAPQASEETQDAPAEDEEVAQEADPESKPADEPTAEDAKPAEEAAPAADDQAFGSEEDSDEDYRSENVGLEDQDKPSADEDPEPAPKKAGSRFSRRRPAPSVGSKAKADEKPSEEPEAKPEPESKPADKEPAPETNEQKTEEAPKPSAAAPKPGVRRAAPRLSLGARRPASSASSGPRP
ncbi:hypothetical protein [Salipiger sp. PrR003]|uniref:hypothetical protein n=1 Tax=Salipiger sp. PrR003 TaxID=2706776 RepID=UPI0013DA838D|nr:hypothetical protein [Salipiger sp. PrR003]NDV52846.1 hypothetical protein [Salipiger sp. PrR003]